jgi:predicted metalloprotease
MRWDPGHESPDVIDRRGERSTAGVGGIGGLLFFLPMLMRSKFGWLIILAVGGYYAWSQFGGGAAPARVHSGEAAVTSPAGDLAHFSSFVLDDTQSMWERDFRERGQTYRRAKLVLFENATQTGCGFGESATGPFYCPTDERAYIDLGFFRDLEKRLGAGGDFAQAYVIAHEIGHHVQKLLGVNDKVGGARSSAGQEGTSVRMELQADCFAGVWGHSTEQRKVLEQGDVDEAIGATKAIGDDTLQRKSTGTVQPETWTHGSSAQRGKWFRRGLESGKIEACDTFSAREL